MNQKSLSNYKFFLKKNKKNKTNKSIYYLQLERHKGHDCKHREFLNLSRQGPQIKCWQ